MWNDQNHSSLPLLTVMTNWLNSKHAHGWYHARNVILKAKSEKPRKFKYHAFWLFDLLQATCPFPLKLGASMWAFQVERECGKHASHSLPVYNCTWQLCIVLCQFMYIAHILHPKLLNKIIYLYLLQECLHLVDSPLIWCLDF